MEKLKTNYIKQSFSVTFEYNVFFTTSLFASFNNVLDDFLKENVVKDAVQKILFVVDEGIVANHPLLLDQIASYFKKNNTIKLIKDILIIPGGEQSKNDKRSFNHIVDAVHLHGIDRHSYLAAIGGGAGT
jgi:3-dehydroquinate synthase